MCQCSMATQSPWPVEPEIWHVARGKDKQWKVLQEGEPTAESRHESRDDAVRAAKALVGDGSEARIKLHNPDGSLDRVLRPRRV